MKTSDKIKKGLECCKQPVCPKDCPYNKPDGICDLTYDMENYISWLEEQVPKWISVEDMMPKNGQIVFCYTKHFYEVLQWDDDSEQWCGQNSVNAKHYVTHWMPIPEIPKEE